MSDKKIARPPATAGRDGPDSPPGFASSRPSGAGSSTPADDVIYELVCRRCASYVPVGELLRDPDTGDATFPGECHRHAPQVGSVIGIDTNANADPGAHANADWPRVWEDDFCGDHSDMEEAILWGRRKLTGEILANYFVKRAEEELAEDDQPKGDDAS